MFYKNFKDIEIGTVFFEWNECHQDWVKHIKVKPNVAMREGLDAEFEFADTADCAFFDKEGN